MVFASRSQVEGGAISSDKIAELKAKRAARKRATVAIVDSEEPTKAAEKKKVRCGRGGVLPTLCAKSGAADLS